MCGGVPILNPMLMMEHQQMKQGKQQQAVNAFPQATPITHGRPTETIVADVSG